MWYIETGPRGKSDARNQTTLQRNSQTSTGQRLDYLDLKTLKKNKPILISYKMLYNQ